MKKDSEKKKKVRKVNKIKGLDMRSKIKQLLKIGDNSSYLRQLIKNAYTRDPMVASSWIKNIGKELHKPGLTIESYL